jgi:hypothetical protein
MKEKVIELIDMLKKLGYQINVEDKRPKHNIVRIEYVMAIGGTEFERLKAELSYLVFYKEDSLTLSHDRLKVYLIQARRLEHLKEHGEFSKDVQDIAKYILGDENTKKDESKN